MRAWMTYLVLGVALDVTGFGMLLTHLGRTVGVWGIMIGLVGMVFTRSGVLLMRKVKRTDPG